MSFEGLSEGVAIDLSSASPENDWDVVAELNRGAFIPLLQEQPRPRAMFLSSMGIFMKLLLATRNHSVRMIIFSKPRAFKTLWLQLHLCRITASRVILLR